MTIHFSAGFFKRDKTYYFGKDVFDIAVKVSTDTGNSNQSNLSNTLKLRDNVVKAAV